MGQKNLEKNSEIKTKEEIIQEIKDCCELSDLKASEAFHIVNYWLFKGKSDG